MKWHCLSIPKSTSASDRRQEIINLILKHRGLTSSSAIDSFLHPPLPSSLTPDSVGISPKPLNQTIKRLSQAIRQQQPIIIYGDYDADGVTATAILWETLHALGAKVYPFIPSRELHGYGLSPKGITAALALYSSTQATKNPLIITVDNGIVAFEAAKTLKARGLDLIITDHHQLGSQLPPCFSLVHTQTLSGAGVAWILSQALIASLKPTVPVPDNLDLVTLGTVADMMPLLGPNRTIVKFGLKALQTTQRPGLLALYQQADLDVATLSTYHLNFIIAPRLNAMGRLEHALDSLRLLLTKNQARAAALAQTLGVTNQTRQELTQASIASAIATITQPLDPFLIVASAEFHEGVIGLVAGKLVETYSRPALVISLGPDIAKASARSVKGFDVVAYLRQFETHFINVGGHPMAAGLTLLSQNVSSFKQALLDHARQTIKPNAFAPQLEIDCQLQFSDLNFELLHRLEVLKPYGLGNLEPVFLLPQAKVVSSRKVGRAGEHLQLKLQGDSTPVYAAIGFNLAKKAPDIGSQVAVAFTLQTNTWNSRTSLQLVVKDINAH